MNFNKIQFLFNYKFISAGFILSPLFIFTSIEASEIKNAHKKANVRALLVIGEPSSATTLPTTVVQFEGPVKSSLEGELKTESSSFKWPCTVQLYSELLSQIQPGKLQPTEYLQSILTFECNHNSTTSGPVQVKHKLGPLRWNAQAPFTWKRNFSIPIVSAPIFLQLKELEISK